jgi:hypothetical protein
MGSAVCYNGNTLREIFTDPFLSSMKLGVSIGSVGVDRGIFVYRFLKVG